MQSSLEFFQASNEFSAEQLEKITPLIRAKTVAKGQILQHKGEINAKGYFVKKGCLRSYVIDEKGKEHIFMFAPEGWLASDIATQIKKAPSDLFIDAVEDSEIEVFDLRLMEAAGLDTILLFGSGIEKLVTALPSFKNASLCS